MTMMTATATATSTASSANGSAATSSPVDSPSCNTTAIHKNTDPHPLTTLQSNNNNKEVFDRDGFLVVRKALPLEVIAEWHKFATSVFRRTFQQLYEKGHTTIPTHSLIRKKCDDETQAKQKQEENCEKDVVKIEFAMGLGLRNGFSEIVMRSPGRYELSLLNMNVEALFTNDELSSTTTTTGSNSAVGGKTGEHPLQQQPCLNRLKDHLLEIAPPLLDAHSWEEEEIHVASFSLILSNPGSTDQSWHADGGHASRSQHLPCHCLNVFIPLVDVTAELGPTQFRPGTHYHTRQLASMMLAARARRTLRDPVAPLLNKGDVLLFDYRVLHRGLANNTTRAATTTLTTNNDSASSMDNGQETSYGDGDRLTLVLTLSKPWFRDVLNFPRNSLEEAPKDN